MKKFFSSRLARKQEAKNIRRAVLFAFLSLILVLSLVFLGLPFLIKMAVFLGNIRSSSLPNEQEDNIPPPAPLLLPLPEATSSAQLNLSGFAEPGAIVEIFVSGISQKKIVADSNGSFSVDNLRLTEGRNEIYAIATDKAGNVSQSSEKLIVLLDQTPPELVILQPTNNATFYGMQKRIEIKGETEEDASVVINDRLAVMEAGGKFRYSLTLSEGENKVKIVATDKAGNQTEEELTLYLE